MIAVDGSALTTLFDVLSGEALDLLNLLGIVWLARGQMAHERRCRERHDKHYAAEDDLNKRVSRIEGAIGPHG